MKVHTELGRACSRVALAVGVLLLGIGLVSAQSFVVESTSINDGDVNVATPTDITISFSEPISVIGLPELGESLPIDLGIDPGDEECAAPPALVAITPGGCIGGWSLQDDNATLVLEDVSLAADQVQTLLVLLAISEDGDLLETPVAVRFSTGDSLPQGSVSGTVASGEVDVAGSIVALAPGTPLGIVVGDDTAGVDALIGFADADGNYAVSFIPDGIYLPVGIQLDFSILDGLLGSAGKVAIEGLAIGLYDADGDRISDVAAVSGGGETSGVDIGLSSGDKLAEMAGIARDEIVAGGAPTSRLSLAGGGALETDGTAPFWTMLFTDLLSGQGWISVSMGDVALAPTRIDTVEDLQDIVFLFATAAFTNYANSDQAVDWFLQAGGDDFLADYPESVGFGLLMDRALFDFLLQILEGGNIDLPLGPGFERMLDVLKTPNVVEALGGAFAKQQALEAWIVGYVGLGEELGLHLVAMGDDGTPILVVGSSPAAINGPAADAEAEVWDPGAYLVSVESLELPVTRHGSALAWGYNYYSASSDSVLTVIVSGGPLGGALLSTVVEKEQVATTEAMIENWIDSPEAVEKADVIAASFLDDHPAATATVELSKGLQAGNPGLAIWRVIYSATDIDGTPVERVVDLDASNGVFVAVEQVSDVPADFSLRQNYPNPFNPETVIPYQLQETGQVNLTVFDAIGRAVRVLVDETQTSGTYRVNWDARDDLGNLLPSGVYLYRLEADGSVQTRRMTLVK